MHEDKLKRINELAKKKREQGLNNEELQEQQVLYGEYLAEMRGQVRNSLDEAGYRPRSQQCSCGCKGEHHHHHH